MSMHVTAEDLAAMEQRKRVSLVNSTGGFKSVCLIGTADAEGSTNLAVFSSITHIGASPPLMALVIRPDSADRHTLTNILETGCYTINHLNEAIYRQGHQTSARYIREISEFDAVGLTREYKHSFQAPYVKESTVQIGLQFRERVDLSINNTILVIGEIRHLYFPGSCWMEDGFLDLEKAGTITCSGLDSYHKTQVLERLSYAKPGRALTSIQSSGVSQTEER